MQTADQWVLTRERMLRELSSDLAESVRLGEMTGYSMKADQWSSQS
jgi:hypothetical protein